jgi:phytoene synthase
MAGRFLVSGSLAQSYAHCRRLARKADSSFYWSFWLLPRPKYYAMCALYAFLRRTDDLADGPHPAGDRRAALARWRESLARALNGKFDDPLFPALADTAARFGVPTECLWDAIDGVEMDLGPCRYETFGDLAPYCHRVASAAGLACLHIWGYSGGEGALVPARHCGLAFQLTNILRDVAEDAGRDRVYLPLEDLRRFRYGVDELKRSVRDERFAALMRFQIERTEQYYRAGQALVPFLSPDGRRVFRPMLTTYRSLLEEIKRRDGDVFTRPVRLGWWTRLRIALASA